MKFVIWLVKSTLFHLLILLAMIIMATTWEAGVDKTVALYMTVITLVVLVVGKLIYFRKNAKQSTKTDQK
jgi:hypothetical protein